MLSAFGRLQSNTTAPPPSNATQPVSNNRVNKCRLPTIDVPKFDGSWNKWLPFRDTFKSIVHDSNLDNIEKLHYLRWALNGEAYKLIEALEVTRENYNTAWSIITKRYENNKTIIQQHTQMLINLDDINKESHSALRNFINSIQQHTQTLKRLEQPVEKWDTLLIQILVPKLDNLSRRAWESERADKGQLPTLAEFLAFLEKRCSVLEAMSSVSAYNGRTNQNGNKQDRGKVSGHVTSHMVVGAQSCAVCKAAHKIYECEKFHQMSPYQRFESVKISKLCFNCLKPFHGKKCVAGNCKKCNQNHNTLLHFESRLDQTKRLKTTNCNTALVPQQANFDDASNSNQDLTKSLASCQVKESSGQVLLSTAIVNIQSKSGNFVACRALLDSGSQVNLMTDDLHKRLGLSEQKADVTITGIGQSTSKPLKQTWARISSKINSFGRNIQFLVLPGITGSVPERQIALNNVFVPPNIKLADPNFHKPGRVDILLGASIFWDLLSVGQMRLDKSQPILQKTILGWIVSGPLGVTTNIQRNLKCNYAQNVELEKLVEKFWQVEEIKIERCLSAEERFCENHFIRTHSRTPEGRFVVELPLRENHAQLGDSYEMAKRRFFSLEKKLTRNPELKQEYASFIREYLDLGHMHIVRDAEKDLSQGNSYYLPHHAVFKPDSTTTRMRVVFDGSAKSSSGVSLNKILAVGCSLQEDLFNIVVRFRQHAYALSADVIKMYRQVELANQHRRLQRILWRFDPAENLKVYELATVTYGQASSSFLATRALYQSALDAVDKYPAASDRIRRDFYVDDLLTGGNDLEEIRRLKSEIIDILGSSGFELRK